MHLYVVIALVSFAAAPTFASLCYHTVCPVRECLKTVIDAGAAATCKMDEQYGCSILRTYEGTHFSVMATCESSTCTPVEKTELLGLSVVKTCCNSTLCNSGKITTGQPVLLLLLLVCVLMLKNL